MGRGVDFRQVDGQYEKFTQVEKTIKNNLAKIVNTAPKMHQPHESMLAGSIAMALCYIARLDRTKAHGSKLNARILLLTGSAECASQYMTYMNVFFTAQKQNIVLDVCALDKAMTLLQQGCDITGGQYLRLQQTDGLLQYLLVSQWSIALQLEHFNSMELFFVVVVGDATVGVFAGSAHSRQASVAASN